MARGGLFVVYECNKCKKRFASETKKRYCRECEIEVKKGLMVAV